MKQFRDFYYSSDNYLFWIAGYAALEVCAPAIDLINDLTKDTKAFAEKVGCKFKEVQTLKNDKPPRFQYMRVFYIKTDTPHPEAFVSTRPMHEILTT